MGLRQVGQGERGGEFDNFPAIAQFLVQHPLVGDVLLNQAQPSGMLRQDVTAMHLGDRFQREWSGGIVLLVGTILAPPVPLA